MSNDVDMVDWDAWIHDSHSPSSPGLPSFEEPTTSDFDDMPDGNAPFDQDLETFDCTAAYEELMSGPFGPAWENLDQAVLQPDR
jgi:hypothetical protein